MPIKLELLHVMCGCEFLFSHFKSYCNLIRSIVSYLLKFIIVINKE